MKPVWLQKLFTTTTPKAKPEFVEQMNPGDYHSGSEGYSPNTAYPETQYGSMFDEDAEWNEHN